MNPVFFSYVSDIDPALAAPSAVIVAGRSNWLLPGFQASRVKGAEVLAYLNVIERPDVIKANEPILLDVYMGDPAKVPLWGGNRIHWAGTKMTDIRPGSAWIKYCLAWCEKLMVEGKVDGLFLDVIGSRPWGDLIKWETWPIAEQAQWTSSAGAFVAALDAVRRRVNPRFKIVNNNVWDKTPSAEAFVDGVCLEHPPASGFHTSYSSRAFGNLGQKRLIIIAKSDFDAAAWINVQGPTHICVIGAGQNYSTATPKYSGAVYKDLREDESSNYIKALKAELKATHDLLADALVEKMVAEDNLSISEAALKTANAWVDKLGRKQAIALRAAQDLVSILAV